MKVVAKIPSLNIMDNAKSYTVWCYQTCPIQWTVMMDGATSIDCGMKVIVAKFYEYSIHGSEHW